MKIADYIFAGFLGTSLIGILGIGMVTSIADWQEKQIKKAYPVLDLNSDEIPDLVVERLSGTKTPLYGVRNGDHINYVPAEEMLKLFPDSKVDYQKIEDDLNPEKTEHTPPVLGW